MIETRIRIDHQWSSKTDIPRRSYECGYCGNITGTNEGYYTNSLDNLTAYIYICGGCNNPTYIVDSVQVPNPILGVHVDNLPENLARLYNEARSCTSLQAYTACVLCCRKILMHISVEKGAPQKNKFWEHVKYLVDNHYAPRDSAMWVDHIRDKGNEANHEIVFMSKSDALRLLKFCEALLRYNYEYQAIMKDLESEN